MGPSSGIGRVYRRSGGSTFAHEAQLVPPGSTSNSVYGQSVAFSFASSGGTTRNIAVLGAPGSNMPPAIFSRSSSGSWSHQSTLPAESLVSGYGQSLYVDFARFMIGAPITIVTGMVLVDRIGEQNGTACTAPNQCSSGFCVDGVCCNSACGDGAADCQACSRAQNGKTNGECTPLRTSGVVCRAAAGTCDDAETCSTSSTTCPANARNTGRVCRAAAGVCDKAETCNGSSDSCPSDAKLSSSTVCRAAAGACDRAETCNGSSNSCPSDTKQPSGMVCGPTPSPNEDNVAACTGFDICTRHCDLTDICDGASNSCPNRVKPAGYNCRSTNNFFDPVEACDGTSPACPPNM